MTPSWPASCRVTMTKGISYDGTKHSATRQMDAAAWRTRTLRTASSPVFRVLGLES